MSVPCYSCINPARFPAKCYWAKVWNALNTLCVGRAAGSVAGFCTALPRDVNSLCLWPEHFSGDEHELFLSLGRYFQYGVTHDDLTCRSISRGQVSTPAASFQKSPFPPLLIDWNWQLHLLPDESLIVHGQASAKKMLNCFSLFMMSTLETKRK